MPQQAPRSGASPKGPRIPPGYERADGAARRAGVNPEVLQRRLRRDPQLVERLGARKIPWRRYGLWVLPEGAWRKIPRPPEGRPSEASGRVLSDAEREEIARRARDGENHTELAAEFGVHRSYVGKLKKRRPKNR